MNNFETMPRILYLAADKYQVELSTSDNAFCAFRIQSCGDRAVYQEQRIDGAGACYVVTRFGEVTLSPQTWHYVPEDGYKDILLFASDNIFAFHNCQLPDIHRDCTNLGSAMLILQELKRLRQRTASARKTAIELMSGEPLAMTLKQHEYNIASLKRMALILGEAAVATTTPDNTSVSDLVTLRSFYIKLFKFISKL